MTKCTVLHGGCVGSVSGCTVHQRGGLHRLRDSPGPRKQRERGVGEKEGKREKMRERGGEGGGGGEEII